MQKNQYPAKVLLAWAAAIRGDAKISQWLMKNGYSELAIFEYALYHKEDARQWLLQNGFEHLMATIAAAEGDAKAMHWLETYQWEVLAHVARVADGYEPSEEWLKLRGHGEMLLVAREMRAVKDEIERDNNDVHKINKY